MAENVLKRLYRAFRGDAFSFGQYSAKGSGRYDPYGRMTATAPKELKTQEAKYLYQGFWLTKNLVDIPAEDMTRSGWGFVAEGEGDLEDLIERKLNELQVQSKFHDMARYELLYGDGGNLIALNDGVGDLTQAVNERAISDVDFLNAFGRDAVADIVLNEDVMSKNYGMAESFKLYRKSADKAVALPDTSFHHSRVLHFQMRGFAQDKYGVSIYQPMLHELQILHTAEWSVGQLLYSMVFKVLKSDWTWSTAAQREEILKQFENDVNALTAFIIDKDDDLSFKSPTAALGGVEALFSFLWDCVTGAARVPKAHLLGQRQGTLAGAEWDSRAYYSRILGIQESYLRELLEKLVRYLLLAKNIGGLTPEQVDNELGWSIEFNPLFVEDESERADRELKLSQSLRNLHDGGIISTPEARSQIAWASDEASPMEQIVEPEPTMPEQTALLETPIREQVLAGEGH